MSSDISQHHTAGNQDEEGSAPDVSLAKDLVLGALEFLRAHYTDYTFYVERDVVWTVQTLLRERLRSDGLTDRLAVHNDYPIFPGPRRSLSADFCLVASSGVVYVAVEFKYEPSHQRPDILKRKLPVVSWGKEGVSGDILKVKRMVDEKRAYFALSILVDEGRYFRHREPPAYSQWFDWGSQTSVLIAKFEAPPEGRPLC